MKKWIKEMEYKAKKGKYRYSGSLWEKAEQGESDDRVDYSPAFNDIALSGTFKIAELEALVNHMKKYTKGFLSSQPQNPVLQGGEQSRTAQN